MSTTLSSSRASTSGSETVEVSGRGRGIRVIDLPSVFTTAEEREMLSVITAFDLSRNELEELTQLHPLRALRRLNASYNHIHRFDGLPLLLTQLNLAHNKLEHLDHIAQLPHLRELDVSFNRLTSLAGLSPRMPLEVLTADDNRLQRTLGLEGMQTLRVISLSNNFVEDMDELLFLPTTPHLQLLSLTGNPVTRARYYRSTVGRLQPAVVSLDGAPLLQPQQQPHAHSDPERETSRMDASSILASSSDAAAAARAQQQKANLPLPGRESASHHHASAAAAATRARDATHSNSRVPASAVRRPTTATSTTPAMDTSCTSTDDAASAVVPRAAPPPRPASRPAAAGRSGQGSAATKASGTAIAGSGNAERRSRRDELGDDAATPPVRSGAAAIKKDTAAIGQPLKAAAAPCPAVQRAIEMEAEEESWSGEALPHDAVEEDNDSGGSAAAVAAVVTPGKVKSAIPANREAAVGDNDTRSGDSGGRRVGTGSGSYAALHSTPASTSPAPSRTPLSSRRDARMAASPASLQRSALSQELDLTTAHLHDSLVAKEQLQKESQALHRKVKQLEGQLAEARRVISQQLAELSQLRLERDAVRQSESDVLERLEKEKRSSRARAGHHAEEVQTLQTQYERMKTFYEAQLADTRRELSAERTRQLRAAGAEATVVMAPTTKAEVQSAAHLPDGDQHHRPMPLLLVPPSPSTAEPAAAAAADDTAATAAPLTSSVAPTIAHSTASLAPEQLSSLLGALPQPSHHHASPLSELISDADAAAAARRVLEQFIAQHTATLQQPTQRSAPSQEALPPSSPPPPLKDHVAESRLSPAPSPDTLHKRSAPEEAKELGTVVTVSPRRRVHAQPSRVSNSPPPSPPPRSSSAAAGDVPLIVADTPAEQVTRDANAEEEGGSSDEEATVVLDMPPALHTATPAAEESEPPVTRDERVRAARALLKGMESLFEE